MGSRAIGIKAIAVDAPDTLVIVNPKAANGRAGRDWPKIVAELEQALGPVQIVQTGWAGHGINLAADGVRAGAHRIIAVGGDGTINEVVNGLFAASPDGVSETVLGIIPRGSGSDFWKSLTDSAAAEAALGFIRQGGTRRVDVARVSYVDFDGRPQQRHCVNITSFGIGGAVARLAERFKGLGGKLSMMVATLLASPGYKHPDVTLVIDDGEARQIVVLNVAVGNGQYHGGGMRPCPRANLSDGYLDVTIIRKVPHLEMLWSLPMLYSGRIYEHRLVEFHRARRLRASANTPTLIEIDGEPLGQLPLGIAILPKALAVYAPSSTPSGKEP